MEEINLEQTRALLYKLIYQALIEIRFEAYETKNGRIHKLSDLAHKLPLQLLNPDCDYNTVLEKLKAQADSIGAGKWFDNAIEQLSQQDEGSASQS